MKDFENLKSQWESQPEMEAPNNGVKLIIEKMTRIKNKQRITNVVLSITVLVLIGFFFYISAYSNFIVTSALILMAGSLLIRVFTENLSIRKLKRINVTTDAVTFKNKISEYYKKRIQTHYILTPIIILFYSIGFVILLPYFKEALSSWFYTYIQVSAIVVLIVLGFFIRKQILKELEILKGLSD